MYLAYKLLNIFREYGREPTVSVEEAVAAAKKEADQVNTKQKSWMYNKCLKYELRNTYYEFHTIINCFQTVRFSDICV